MLRGLGVSEGWTDTFVSATAHDDVDLIGPAVRVANPLDAEKPFLRRSLLPGLLGALAYNAGRRQPDVRLFEVGVVFSHPGAGLARVVERSGAGGTERAELPGERELLSAVFAGQEDDARRRWPPGTSWRTRSVWTGCAWSRRVTERRRCRVCIRPARRISWPVPAVWTRSRIGAVGEIDPAVAARFDLTRPSGSGTTARRVGWLEVDLGLLFDEERVPRRITMGVPSAASRHRTSTWPSSWRTGIRPMPSPTRCGPPGASSWSPCTSSTSTAVPGIAEGTRSLAYRLRFCADDRTLTDDEVGGLRTRCIDAVTHGLRRLPALSDSPPWQGGPMEVRLVDPADENELEEWTAVLRASDEDFWPDLDRVHAVRHPRLRPAPQPVEAVRPPGGRGSPTVRSSVWA